MAKKTPKGNQIMSPTIKNIFKETEMTEMNQIEILEPKRTITNVKNSLQTFNTTHEPAEERIHDLGNMSLEISQTEDQKGQRIKKNEQSLSGPWNTIKHTNIHIMGVS